MKNIIIYLIGFAGVGKFTIAKELSLHLQARIIDNHLINNPILQLIQLDGKTPISTMVWEKIAQIREIVFTTIEEVSPSDFNFIFTNELLQSSQQDINVYYRVSAIAEKRKSLFVPIRLVCDRKELSRRVSSPERAALFKMTDIKSTEEKFEKQEVFIPDHPLTQTIDVTNLTPQEVAKKIMAILP